MVSITGADPLFCCSGARGGGVRGSLGVSSVRGLGVAQEGQGDGDKCDSPRDTSS